MFASIFEGFLNALKIFFTAAEYNPFHSGHQYHIEAQRRAGATHVVAVMSGNYVQRGEPALFDSFLRAEAAVRGGADLVLSLPLPWAVAPAERFAFGAAYLAVKSGVCDVFSFGCESEEPALLTQTARLLSQMDSQLRPAAAKRENQSYPALLSSLLPAPCAKILEQPNNVLGVAYIRSLEALGFSGEILPVRRTCAHDGAVPEGAFAGASYLRGQIREGKQVNSFIPDPVQPLVSRAIAAGRFTGVPEKWQRQLLAVLRLKERDDFANLPFAGGGLEDRFYQAVRTARDLNELYAAVKTKRFTHASVRRLCLHAALGVTEDICRAAPPYLRVMAVGKGGNEILRQMREKAGLPVIQRKADVAKLDFFVQKVYALECRGTDFYHTLTECVRPCGTEMTDQIFRIGEEE